jgi:tocopherol O-methyltransferase
MSWTCLAQASFQVADALDQPFPDGQFDLVWSMESGEHMPNKKKVNILLKRNLTVRVTAKP